MTQRLPIHKYNASGGVVTSPNRTRVLVLLRPGRLGPDATPEVRLPKGHIEPDESAALAALREVREEAGLTCPEILVDLGHQSVEFDWKGRHYVRDEHYFLMTSSTGDSVAASETQFEPLWLTWSEALRRLTYAAEREWVRIARSAAGSQS